MKQTIDRRALVKSAAGIWIAGSAASSAMAGIFTGPRVRYIMISRSADAVAAKFVAEVGGYIARRDQSWSGRLERLTIDRDIDAVTSILNQYGPQTEVVEWPIIAAIPPNHTAGDEVEIWSLEWLNAAEEAITDACYPISGGWWSVEGDWNPTAEKVRKHLFESPNHTEGHFVREWLDLLNRSELQSIHSDHHREMTGQGQVHWQHVNGECPTR
jgi:hypothetical protein